MRTCPACGADAPRACGADAPAHTIEFLVPCDACGVLLRVDLNEIIVVPDWNADCPCPSENCERHGKCRPCHENHHKKDALPFCLR